MGWPYTKRQFLDVNSLRGLLQRDMPDVEFAVQTEGFQPGLAVTWSPRVAADEASVDRIVEVLGYRYDRELVPIDDQGPYTRIYVAKNGSDEE